MTNSSDGRIKWVVYAKPPFGGPDQVLRYLARYTHRVAISNGRLFALEEGRVRFRWRDSRDRNQIKAGRVHSPFPAARAARQICHDPATLASSPTGIATPW